jgi:hypothetical protein
MRNIFPFLAFTACFTTAIAQGKPDMRLQDKIRIKEAISISEQFGDKIWKGINGVPFVIILVTDSVEFLINHPFPSNDFTFLESDSVLKTKIYCRPRQYDKHFLATFPAVNGVTCIVVGTPENTHKNSTDWIITLLHEHFHQYEYASPKYFEGVDSLNLSGGDQTGMWMLNYPFPYADTGVIEQYKNYTSALWQTLSNNKTREFELSFNSYSMERKKFKQLLPSADYRYFSFQIWQEGIARYTEYKFLEVLSNYDPPEEIKRLPDFIPYKKYKATFYQEQSKQLSALDLKSDKRICFYAIGFAEGLLLDKLNPNWRTNFLVDRFYIERYSKKYDAGF